MSVVSQEVEKPIASTVASMLISLAAAIVHNSESLLVILVLLVLLFLELVFFFRTNLIGCGLQLISGEKKTLSAGVSSCRARSSTLTYLP